MGQIVSVRSRLNRLAIQQGIFESLSLIVGSGAIVFLAAYLLEPLKFLCVAALLAAVLIVGLVRATRRAFRMRANSDRAAMVADERAALKGRLATVVSLARTSPHRGHLWPYLVEDTLTLRERFEPRTIEPRRVSRSIYGLLAYCLLAALVVGFALISRHPELASKAAQADLQVDVNDLDVRSADSPLGTPVEVSGDPAAMRKLADKLAIADQDAGEPDSALGRLMGRARDLAGNIQDRMLGRPSSGHRLRLRITDSGEESRDDPDHPFAKTPRRHRGDNGAGQFEHDEDRTGNDQLPRPDSSPAQTAQRGGAGGQSPGQSSAAGEPTSGDSSKDAAAKSGDDDQGGGGSSHGSGSDPQHLFGAADEPPIGSEGFEITIEARPAEHGPNGVAQSYLPPKVRAALNPHQHSDEPIARESIPDDDRIAVKRVFER